MSNNSVTTREPVYWKNIKDITGNAAYQAERAQNDAKEFPDDFDRPTTDASAMSRRTFVGLLSASMALTATACRRPDHKIVPGVNSVEYMLPGIPNYYTTVFPRGNDAVGLEIKTREGRPIKIDGNKMFAATKGSVSGSLQAQLLTLYDPDRMNRARINNGYIPPQQGITQIAKAIGESAESGKKTLILVNEHASPTMSALLSDIESAIPSIQFVTVPSIAHFGAAKANAALFGIDAEFVPDYAKAMAILAIDADFLGAYKCNEQNISGFSQNRRPDLKNPAMSKLIVAESTYSLTGLNADKRIKLTPSEYEGFLATVLNEVAARTGSAEVQTALAAAGATPAAGETASAAKEAAAALIAQGERGLVVVGAHLSPAAHAMGALINYALGAVGAGKSLDPARVLPNSHDRSNELATFRNDLKSGKVGVVICADTNVEYFGDTELRQLLASVPNRYAFSLYEDETAAADKSSIYLPSAHFLESWGDVKTYDGALVIQQPIIAPLNGSSLSLGDFCLQLAQACDDTALADYSEYVEYLRSKWKDQWQAGQSEESTESFERFWEKTLRDGLYKPQSNAVVSGSAETEGAAGTAVALNAAGVANIMRAGGTKPASSGNVHVLITPSYALYDGAQANNGWLQELSDPVTKIVWDNVALVSKTTAERLNVENDDVITIATDAGSIDVPVWIQPGMTDEVLAVSTGYGRTNGGVVCEGVGVNAFTLLSSGQPLGYVEASATKTSKRHTVVTTQSHHNLIGRKIVQETSSTKIAAGSTELFDRVPVPGRSPENRFELPLQIMAQYEHLGHRWGLSIDLSTCVGCNSCLVACQSENNISVVGKEEVGRGREMNWLRLDRYYLGKEDMTYEEAMENPQAIVQPMACQQCENAPCENVCPVAATTHSPEGLNEMTYNRCVGTRYCLNNCPYKVRRFNFLDYNTDKRTPLDLVFNPVVTKRMRGVMEKCTWCVQRINEAKAKAKDQGRARVRDGEVTTACEQACPAGSIVFGDQNDDKSRISALKKHERGFLVLEELNVRPQVTYLAKVYNDDPVSA